jgi:MoxR-like ATPase
MSSKSSSSEIKKWHKKLREMKNEISKVIIGNENVINCVLRAILCNGHVLIEGPTGVGKTVLAKTLQEIIDGAIFKRITFTVDMLPSDITGSEVYDRATQRFEVRWGPVFTNILLADEINRAPPKVQSALLQAMQEREVTIGKQTYRLPSPFFVFATQNPQEEQGIFPLPEAQVDRFLFNVRMEYLPEEEEEKLMENNLEIKSFKDFNLKKVVTLSDILKMQEVTKKIKLPEEVKEYTIEIVNATRYPEKYGYKMREYIKWGGSPRATIALNYAAQANALLDGRDEVEIKDVREVAIDVLQHRIILTYEGRTLGIDKREIIKSILHEIPTLG